MTGHRRANTSIGLGGGEVVLVDPPLTEVVDTLQIALSENEFVRFVDVRGNRECYINPAQVKVVQPLTEPPAPKPRPTGSPLD